MSTKLAMIGGGEMFAVNKEEIGDLAMCRDETLALPGRLEAHHPALSSPHGKM